MEAVICSREYKQKVLSEKEKYRKANEITKKLSSGLVAEVGTKSYLKRMKVLADLVESWQKTKKLKLLKSKTSTKITMNCHPASPLGYTYLRI